MCCLFTFMKRLLIGVVVVAIFTSIAVSVSGAQVTVIESDWPQPRHDSGRTGHNPAATGPEADVGAEWVTRIGSGGIGDVSPTIASETVYVGNNDGELYALDAEDGSQVWQTTVGPHVRSAAAVGEEHVFVIVRGKNLNTSELVAVERDTGEIDWRYAPEYPDTPAAWLQGQPVVVDGTVYVGGNVGGPNVRSTGVVVALDPASGDTAWRRALTDDFEHSVSTTPAIADGTVYVYNHPYANEGRNGTLYAVDATNGDVTWTASVPPGGWSVLATDETVYVAGLDAHAVNATTGEVSRTYDIDSDRFTPPALANGTLYYDTGVDYATDQPNPTAVAAMNTTTGEELWQTRVEWVETPPAVSKTLVVVGTIDGELYALDRTDGDVLWNYTVDDRLGVDSAPAIVGETVYLGPDPWHVYAFREGGSARKGGSIGAVGDWLRANPVVAFLVIGLGGGTLSGLVIGGLSFIFLRKLVSPAPQRILAAKVFRTKYGSVTGGQRAVAHILAAVVVAVVYFTGWTLLAYLGPVSLLQLFGRAAGILFVLSPLVGLLAVLAVVGVAWWVLAYRWLPANESVLDAPIQQVRRQWGAVHLVYGLVLLVVYQFVTLVFAIAVFQPF